jgi:hypothetical protein
VTDEHAENMALVRGMVKRANAASMLNFANPATGALAGGLIGGGLVGGIDLLRRRDPKRALQSALLGGVLGAGAGASAGHLKTLTPDHSLAGGVAQTFHNMAADPRATLDVQGQKVPLPDLQPQLYR